MNSCYLVYVNGLVQYERKHEYKGYNLRRLEMNT